MTREECIEDFEKQNIMMADRGQGQSDTYERNLIAIKSLKKLDKIEQIIEQEANEGNECCGCRLNMLIREVLESEK